MSADIVEFPDYIRASCMDCGGTKKLWKLPAPNAVIMSFMATGVTCPHCGGNMKVSGLNIDSKTGMTTRLKEEEVGFMFGNINHINGSAA
ncbi:MAG: hypothetical protein JKP98_12530 [Rhodobacteraceae bacterium]|jgi:hypothetical protein|nr:hypothetical protein [Alphaproteobacteria bacterium]MBL4557607.1 hypothetical protein [Paracoccaceae bacterium]